MRQFSWFGCGRWYLCTSLPLEISVATEQEDPFFHAPLRTSKSQIFDRLGSQGEQLTVPNMKQLARPHLDIWIVTNPHPLKTLLVLTGLTPFTIVCKLVLDVRLLSRFTFSYQEHLGPLKKSRKEGESEYSEYPRYVDRDG